MTTGDTGGRRPGVLEMVTDLLAQAQLLDALLSSADNPAGAAARVVVEVDAAAWSAAVAARASAEHHTPLALPT